MKKQDVVNLIKYHVDGNEDAFASEAADIAREFDTSGDGEIARYIMELISDANCYVPQEVGDYLDYGSFKYLRKCEYSDKPLFLPNIIEEDLMGITRAINSNSGLSKFLFYGLPGSGKTESAYQIARLLRRDILSVDFELLVDSRLGETAKNVSRLFDEIRRVPFAKAIVVFDEIDSIVLDRVNKNDLREMGRVASMFLKCMDKLDARTVIIATTNLYDDFDKAIIRRFDATLSFNRYSSKDLMDVADAMLAGALKKAQGLKMNMRLFNKTLSKLDEIPYPGEMKQIIKTSVAFCDSAYSYDYLRKIYLSLNGDIESVSIQELQGKGFTMREIEILSKIPKSSVSRKLRSGKL